MGMAPTEYYRMTWRQYILTRRGHGIKRSHEFEHTRAIVYHFISVHRDPNKPFPSMEKFWPLPTDDHDIDENDAKRLEEKLEKFIKEKLHR